MAGTASQSRQNKFKGARTGQEKVKLAPDWIVYIAFFISFAVPNLVFSGRQWYDTLHIMKWFVTMVPIGVLTIIAGISLMIFGVKRTNFTIDPFGAIWLLLLLLVTAHPFLTKLTSVSTYSKEWFYFASLFAVYMLAYNLRVEGRLHRALLWGSSVNAAVNVLFAELLVRNLNKPFSFILDVPGNYIGNTAQQEMFGLWMAMAVLNCLFLHLSYIEEDNDWKISLKRLPILLNIFFLSVNSWGLWCSTARGAILSLSVSVVILLIGLKKRGDSRALKSSFKVLGIVAAFLIFVLAVSSITGVGRGSVLVNKMWDMIKNPTSVGGRISIWRTSFEIFRQNPTFGVGLGHYKWHFLDGQRLFFQRHPELTSDSGYEWQFTYWAHSEYIQWLCETGLVGGVILLILGGWWLFSFIRAMTDEKKLPMEAIWGCSMLFLLWFDAIFSRPFHRIENSVWMSLAFALANRSIMPQTLKWTAVDNEAVYKIFGGVMVAVALSGFVFIAGGIAGDKLIYRSLAYESSAQDKIDLLKKAETKLMSRDDARERLGYLYVQVGKLRQDGKIMVDGIKLIYEAFIKRPTSMLLFDLLSFANQIENHDLMESLSKYIRPGMFGIGASGEILNSSSTP